MFLYQVVSEEHETKPIDLAGIVEPNKNLPDVQSIDSGKDIPYSDITVWIDPLDATQEFTGTCYACVYKKMSFIFCFIPQNFAIKMNKKRSE